MPTAAPSLAPKACTVADLDELREESKRKPREASEGFSSAMLPSGGVAVLRFPKQIPEADKLIFRAWALRDDEAPFSLTILGRGESREDNAAKTTVSIALPTELSVGPTRFYVFACESSATAPPSTELKFSTVVDRRVTGAFPAAVVAIIVVLIFYGFATWARACIDQDKSYRAARNGDVARSKHWPGPLTTTRGVTGRASLSSLQIFWFSLVVLGVSSYVLARTGQLGDLSTDVLMLLGIGTAGSAAGKVTAKVRKRLSWDNYVFLKKMGLEFESKQPTQAYDLVSDAAGQFDVYKFQMLAFSLLVGIALILTGAGGLGDFTIPEAFLGILGLSQVVYVGGKAIAPPTMGDFDAQLGELRALEQKVRAGDKTSEKLFVEKFEAVQEAYAGITNTALSDDADKFREYLDGVKSPDQDVEKPAEGKPS